MATQQGRQVEARPRREPAPFDDLDRLFDRFRGLGRWPWPRLGRRPSLWRMEEWAPDIDVLEREGKLVVRADLPGVKREDIEVAVEGGMLVIRGRRHEEKEVKEEDYYRSERATGEFYRAVSLPEGVTADAIQATYTDGVLEVEVTRPKAAETKRVQVEVKEKGTS